ncbi:hypothetical protein CIK97_00555 [Prevotella sp. P3-120]|uniref:methyltransferase RsmF C-terminal domain-like protein n=1 Tax=unclassified Prevotella TaxID=2638335 RepID=UPI000B976678|nr:MULTISPECIES: hypothetical protein [unclassified Prevotella]OYP49159.1 hypothetical protein CIK93_11895 [Prevotella sp. P3-92]OYP52567.1 hypothetical protein CIK97_00555 [Prevotella sp. P3-120]
MTQLPIDFTDMARRTMGEERFDSYLKAFETDAPVSIRLNPEKAKELTADGERVPWCRNAYYLPQRPNFTYDPLLHAGCYYVQEAGSMFLDTVMQQWVPDAPVVMIDFCAAPGGKSLLARTALAAGSVMFSNEPMRNRANILAENVEKWGYADHFVTNNFPRDYRRAKMIADVVLCDVPCSGEGMFRKDEATIREWSMQNVEKCARLQREIVADAWSCLADGGLFIYSTCTFNTHEDEENIQWMMDELGAEVLPVKVDAAWNITGSLLDGFSQPVYRFIPGISKGEGLFLCVLRKGGAWQQGHSLKSLRKSQQNLNIIYCPKAQPDMVKVEVNYQQAMAYLRHEAITLGADVPRGMVGICFEGHLLGLAKNIGNRANNLYPKEWKIRTTYIPNEYETILRHT